MTKLGVLLAVALTAGTASADVVVRFDEGAPKDRFTITNTSACALGGVEITIDLAGSAAGLIFDVTGAGAGVEVFQPFELVRGGDVVTTAPEVGDGDTSVTLTLDGLGPQQDVAFTIDVDDTTGGREITVNGSEILGASVEVKGTFGTVLGQFDRGAVARAGLSECVS